VIAGTVERVRLSPSVRGSRAVPRRRHESTRRIPSGLRQRFIEVKSEASPGATMIANRSATVCEARPVTLGKAVLPLQLGSPWNFPSQALREVGGGGQMATPEPRSGIAGISVGGLIVIAGILLMIFWSLWIGLIVVLVGLIAFGGFARGKWY
jgi:hypothetical protein